MLSKSGKRMGRPPKAPELGRRVNVAFRLNDKVRDRAKAAAEQSGRSLSEELERRIEASFDQPDLRTIIREEIEADRERQRKREEEIAYGPRSNSLHRWYANAFTHLNGEPKTDH